MPTINHIAIWTADIERLRAFYETYFGAVSGDLYVNPVKRFKSRFLSFGGSSARLELMNTPDLSAGEGGVAAIGLAHMAFAVGSREAVDALTERLRHDGHAILGEPRTTGDGFYESVVADPEGNRVEITE